MRNQITLTTAAIVAAGTSTASENNGFFYDGFVEYSVIADSDDSEDYFDGSFDLGYRPSLENGDFPIGFTLGADFIEFEGDDLDAIYGSVDWHTSYGTFSIGLPRSVVDSGYITNQSLGNSELYEVQLSQFDGSVVNIFHFLSDMGDIDLGLRWDGEFSNTKIGISYHHIDFSGESADIWAIAARHNFGPVGGLTGLAAYGSYENASSGAASLDNFTVGIEGQYNNFGLGVKSSNNDFVDVSTYNAYASYDFMPELKATFDVFGIEGNSEQLYGLGVSYTFANGIYLDAGYIDASDSGFDGLYDLSLGWSF